MSASLWYLSGPMSGHPAFNYPLFHRTAALFRQHQVPILNPAELGAVDNAWADLLASDLAALTQTAGLILLPGWHLSSGARLEWQWARAHHLPRLPWHVAWRLLCAPHPLPTWAQLFALPEPDAKTG